MNEDQMLGRLKDEYEAGRRELDAYRRDLRAKVVDLEDWGCRRVVGGCECRRSEALRDVLALIDGTTS